MPLMKQWVIVKPHLLQWGYRSPGGYVTFPLKFTAQARAFVQHNGKTFTSAKCDSDNPLIGATFSGSSSEFSDVHYLVIGF